MEVAKYTASLSFVIPKGETAKVDKYLANLSKKFSRFKVNMPMLTKSLGDALDRASNLVTFDITKFSVNKRNMQAALLRASRSVGGGAPPSGRYQPHAGLIAADRAAMFSYLQSRAAGGGMAGNLGSNTYVTQTRSLSPQEWNRREAAKNREYRERLADRRQDNALRASERAANRTPPRTVSERASSRGGSNYLHAGGAAGAFARYGMASMPLIGGVMGLSALSRSNQEAISARLTTQAVVEAQGLVGQGPAAFDWLRNQGNRIGFSYMDQAQDYNNFLSNSLGAGLSLDKSQDIYLGFAEYSKAMGITAPRQKLVMNALSQMQGKGVISMEELRRQMAESMPGTMSVFAEAYQDMTGGGLQGQEALAALLEAVPTGKVRSAEILPIVAEIMRKRAAPKLDVAMKTSQAESERLKNSKADAMMIASVSGVESAFLKLFRGFRIALDESGAMVRWLSQGLDAAATKFERLILFPQSFIRALDGRDSLVADWLGLDQVEELRDDWSEIKASVGEILGMGEPLWFSPFQVLAQELKDLISLFSGITQKFREGGVVSSLIMSDAIGKYGDNPLGKAMGGAGIVKYIGTAGLTSIGEGAAGAYGKAIDVIPFASSHPLLQQSQKFAYSLTTNPYDPFANFMMNREAGQGANTGLMYGNSASAWRDMNRARTEEAAYNVFGRGGFDISQPVQQNTNTFNMEFKFENGDPAVIENWVKSSLRGEIDAVMPMFNYTGN